MIYLWDSTYGYLIYDSTYDSTYGYLIYDSTYDLTYDLFMRFNLWLFNLWFIYDY
jgi:hypothetical protein